MDIQPQMLLLSGLSNEESVVKDMVERIIRTKTKNDFVEIEINKMGKIAEQRDYGGWRISLIGKIKNTVTPFTIDIGVGDVVFPEKVKRTLNTLLDGFEHPEIYTYSFESTIAEKFDAMLDRLEGNGRMKYFYDIYHLTMTNNFFGKDVKEAVRATLANRRTRYNDESMKRIKNFVSDTDMVNRWSKFVNDSVKVDLSFEMVTEQITRFMEPILQVY